MKRLKVSFASEEVFLTEYSRNISNGGIFLPSDQPMGVRDEVEVEIHLDWCSEVVPLAGEVVHCVGPEMAEAGARPGVAIEFDKCASELRQTFEACIGAFDLDDEQQSGVGQRRASRARARVEARVESESGAQFEVRTRDISRSGVLLSAGGDELPLGNKVKIALRHPVSGEQMSIEGSVVREVRTDEGEVAAVGIEFDIPEQEAPQFDGFVERVKTTEHSRSLGAITGPIDELGVESLLEMFGATAPRGTLILTRNALEATIVINRGGFVGACLGRSTGIQALAELMDWREGQFEFQSRVEALFEKDPGLPLAEAIASARELLGKSRVRRPHVSMPPAPVAIPQNARMRLDPQALDEQAGDFDKTEEAIIDLAIVGMTVAKAVEIIPDTGAAVLGAIDGLREQGIVLLDS